MDNMSTLQGTVLLASILAGYENDWARIMVEQIHKSAIHTQTALPFPIPIHKLCNEVRVYVSLHLYLYVEALHTINPRLIKANENSGALQRAASSPLQD